MSTLDRKSLVESAKELNELLQLDPKIKTVAVKTDYLMDEIKKAGSLLESGDVISKMVSDIFEELEVVVPEGVTINGEEETEEEVEEIEAQEEAQEEVSEDFVLTDEILVALATEMNKSMGLEPAIDLELEPDALEAAILENCFEDGECVVFDTDTFSDTSWQALKALDVEWIVTKKETAADKKKREAAEKKALKEASKPAKKEKAPKEPKAPKAPKAPKGPGVIATIVDQIVTNGPITKEDILKALVKIFPEREEAAMKKTINVQIPNRINKEKGITIVDNGKGWQIK